MLEVTWQEELVYTAWLLHLEPMMTSSKADPEIIFLVLFFKPDFHFHLSSLSKVSVIFEIDNGL